MENEVYHAKVQPFDSFVHLYKFLGWAGYYKPLEKPKHKYLEILHYFYRFLVFLLVIIYNLQHAVFIITMNRKDKDKSFESLMIEFPQIYLIAKIVAVNMGSAKLDGLRALMHDPIFAARSARDEELLVENRDTVRRLTKWMFIGAGCSASLWCLSAIYRRMMDPAHVVPIYVPFATDTWPRFFLTIALEHGTVFWTGFAHLTLDVFIGCHYSQATVQLKVIRHNLEHLCDSDKVPGYVCSKNKRTYRYLDELDDIIKERFSHYVERYAKVIWFVEESTAVFNKAISAQFLTTSSVICLVIYKLSMTPAGTVEFMFLLIYFFILQLQVIVYSYFGQLITYESNFVTDSAYKSEWTLLSPRFRKQLLIAMTRWSIPIKPVVSGVVPLSLVTFVTLLRGAFNLLTVLKSKNET